MTTELVFDQKVAIAEWVAEQVGQTTPWVGYYAMGAVRGGEIVAGLVFEQFNGVNASVHIAVSRPGKYLLPLLRHAANYAFGQCKLLRLTGFVEADNEQALKLDYHIGFEHEATLERAGRKGQDVEVLVLWPEKFKYWEAPHGR